MFCPKCGAQLNDKVRFCPKCGTQVQAPQAAPRKHFEMPVSRALDTLCTTVLAIALAFLPLSACLLGGVEAGWRQVLLIVLVALFAALGTVALVLLALSHAHALRRFCSLAALATLVGGAVQLALAIVTQIPALNLDAILPRGLYTDALGSFLLVCALVLLLVSALLSCLDRCAKRRDAAMPTGKQQQVGEER